MPIHDWTRVDAGTYHEFHQDWTVEIKRTLNRGILPPGFQAMVDLKVSAWEPDVATLKLRETPSSGGVAVADAPPQAQQVVRGGWSETGYYARKANRIVVKHHRGKLVAAIEIISPGNKDSKNGIGSFVTKMVDYLRHGINVVVIDPFPPGPRDPEGVHQLIWNEWVGTPVPERPKDKPLTIASYDADEDPVAYINAVGVGDPLPDAPLFLAPGWYINIPLERTYQASWNETPKDTQDLLVSPPPGAP
jgi:hypothetical protein